MTGKELESILEAQQRQYSEGEISLPQYRSNLAELRRRHPDFASFIDRYDKLPEEAHAAETDYKASPIGSTIRFFGWCTVVIAAASLFLNFVLLSESHSLGTEWEARLLPLVELIIIGFIVVGFGTVIKLLVRIANALENKPKE